MKANFLKKNNESPAEKKKKIKNVKVTIIE